MLHTPTFLDHYHARMADGGMVADASQEKAATAFANLYTALRTPAKPPAKKSLLPKLAPRKARGDRTAGLYLWGGVGRGKSMLMDLFVEAIKPHRITRRVHFHAFMRDVHQRLFAFRQLGEGDALPRVIKNIAENCRVLCLDEMQVHDVADAMILSRLFAGLMDAGVCVIFTSNRPPEELYQGGLQREQFVAFIDMLGARIPIVELAGDADYRMAQHRAIEHSYMFPRNAESDAFLLDAWARLTNHAPSEPLRIEVQGRTLRVDKHAGGVAWLTFNELCRRPLGASDYLELIQEIHTLLLQGIPPLTKEERNEAKRFVTLIDTLYDHRIKLIATAETPPEGIYTQGDGNFEFARTVSRLTEMQSDAYWALAKIG